MTFYTSPTGHSIRYGTCQKMLDYIPVEPINLELEMNQATGFFISCQDVSCYENFMKPYFYCAMDANCISPKGSMVKIQLFDTVFLIWGGLNKKGFWNQNFYF